MLVTLIKKDLRRLRANWIGFVILLAMPICITGLIGGIFGRAARSGEMPRIKLAVVNEDDNLVGSLMVSAVTGEQGSEYLDGVHTDRRQATRLINDNKISAVIVVPADFTSPFLAGEKPPPIELIKNPAQSYMPAITEELLRVVAELLNAISVNLGSEIPDLIEVFEQPGAPDTAKMAVAVTRIGRRVERAEDYLFPPIIGLETSERSEPRETGESSDGAKSNESSGGFNVFAFVIPGLAAMFLLFAAEGGTRELLVERRTKTLDRYRTVRVGMAEFFIAKALYSLVVVVLSAGIILIGGGMMFGIVWKHFASMSILTLSYAVFCVGFTYLLVAVIYREQLAAVLNTMVIMLMAFLGGSMMPSQDLPPVIRDTIAPWMPNYLFAEAVKRLQFDMPGPAWGAASLGLVAYGLVMLVVAIVLFQYRLLRGAAE